MAANTNLIPKNIMDEFKKRMQESRGYDAKRADARRFVYTTLTARFGSSWWSLNSEKLLSEMEVAESEQRTKHAVHPIAVCDEPAENLSV